MNFMKERASGIIRNNIKFHLKTKNYSNFSPWTFGSTRISSDSVFAPVLVFVKSGYRRFIYFYSFDIIKAKN
jgi:hypothetical protein